LISALVYSLGLAFAPVAFAQDKMGKDDMSKGTMKDQNLEKMVGASFGCVAGLGSTRAMNGLRSRPRNI
jgi:hypothetical protein